MVLTESLNDLRDAFERPLGFQMCLVGLAALAFGMTSLWLPLGQYDQIIIHSDYPKFYWFTLKQTEWLLEYGSPFGVSPLIHNGMQHLFLHAAIFSRRFIFSSGRQWVIPLCVACMTFSLGVFCILDHIRDKTFCTFICLPYRLWPRTFRLYRGRHDPLHSRHGRERLVALLCGTFLRRSNQSALGLPPYWQQH